MAKEALEQLNARVPGALIDEIDRFCDTNGLLKKEIIELALRRFLAAEREKSPHVPIAGHTG
jgi:hypothetical protein